MSRARCGGGWLAAVSGSSHGRAAWLRPRRFPKVMRAARRLALGSLLSSAVSLLW